MDGNSPSGSAPESVNSSVWRTPVARDLNQDFAGARAVELNRGDFKGFARRKRHGGANIHETVLALTLLAQLGSGAMTICV
jgi:hypothetical protein